MNNVLFAFLLTLFAGLSTGIGGAIAFFAKKTNTKLLSVSLGLSAGVMIYVSLVEIFFKAQEILIEATTETRGELLTVIGFFGGMLLIMIIDKLVPSFENPHEVRKVEEMTIKEKEKHAKDPKLMRVGIFTALAIAIHNFPEGLATFLSAVSDPVLGVSIAIAIAIHNIPEGIAVSVPIYYATGSRKKAFIYSFLSGLAEPLGAVLGFIILHSIMNDILFGMVFAGVAGIMVFISIDELLPTARTYGEHHLSIYGLISGMAIMAISLLII